MDISKKAIITGLIGNVFLMGFKLFAGIYGRSQTMLADSVNHMGDIMSDIAMLFGVKYWSAPPDDTHPHGHQRIEAIVSLVIGVMICVSAVIILLNAITTFGKGHKEAPGIIALVAAIVSLITKETLHRIVIKAGKEARSTSLIAKAMDHRSDAVESIPVGIAVGASILIPGWTFLDHVGAGIVSIYIFQMGIKVIWPAYNELTDRGASDAEIKSIEKLCLRIKGVRSLHKIKTRKLGFGWDVSLHIQVDPKITVKKGHDIAGAVKQCLLKSELDIIDVTIHVEPA